jgi:hypothetical protein
MYFKVSLNGRQKQCVSGVKCVSYFKILVMLEAQNLSGENLKVVWVEVSTLSKFVFVMSLALAQKFQNS